MYIVTNKSQKKVFLLIFLYSGVPGLMYIRKSKKGAKLYNAAYLLEKNTCNTTRITITIIQ